jgi:hypothetical protein
MLVWWGGEAIKQSVSQFSDTSSLRPQTLAA